MAASFGTSDCASKAQLLISSGEMEHELMECSRFMSGTDLMVEDVNLVRQNVKEPLNVNVNIEFETVPQELYVQQFQQSESIQKMRKELHDIIGLMPVTPELGLAGLDVTTEISCSDAARKSHPIENFIMRAGLKNKIVHFSRKPTQKESFKNSVDKLYNIYVEQKGTE